MQRKKKRNKKECSFALWAQKERDGVEMGGQRKEERVPVHAGGTQRKGVGFAAQEQKKRRKSLVSRFVYTKKGVGLKLENKRKEKRVGVRAGGTKINVWVEAREQ